MPPGADACLRCFPPEAEPAEDAVPPQAGKRYDQRKLSSVAESSAESGSDASATVEVD